MAATKVDVIDLIDRHRVTSFQIGVLVLCMLVAALDGFDTQAIGYTAPLITAQVHLPMPQFGQVGSAGLVGAAIGALSFGPLADLFGRKWFMIIAMIVFAIFSYLTAQSGSLNELLAYRFCAGLGLGGVTPAFLALGAELAPKRLRDVFVTVLFASFPFGGLIGSLTAFWVIPNLGWQYVFYIGAVAPLVIAAVLMIWLPESIRFLLARNIGQDQVRRTLERIMPGAVPADAELIAPPDPAREGVPVTHLFTEGRAVPTVLLWVPFFMVFMVLVTVTFWTPAVLNSVGFSLSSAALIIGLNNLGSAIASALSGWLVHRSGAFRVLIPGFILGGLCLAWFGQATTSVVMLSAASFLAGFFVGGTGTGLLAVAAGMYPTSIRSTGIGWAMGMGRVGQVFGPILTGLLVGLGYKVGGIFYAAAVPCFIGALFLVFLMLARPVMEADGASAANAAAGPARRSDPKAA
ncbi:MAG TPA: MFS transporter [Xanthobacteraceae bacterium]|nr:MFS transporter [Xanthobacteraceae bacterium]